MKVKKIIFIIIQIILIAVFLFSVYKVVNWFIENKKTEETLNEIQEHVKDSQMEYIKDDGETILKNYIDVDLDAIRMLNEDTVAYLKVNNTKIEYPVVQGTSNYFYLHNSFDQTYNAAGWIFADYKNKFDETDKNIVIYGHNRQDDSMFGSLNLVLTEEWYTNPDNLIITFITDTGYYEYQIFSMYKVENEEYYITTDFNDNDFEVFLTTIKNRSIYDFGTELDINDKILTLSTCTSTGGDRLAVHALLINKLEF